jgi:hypothetical protein
MLAKIFIASLLLLTCLICSAAQQQSANVQQTLTSEKRALIKELLESTDARKTAISMYKSMVEQEENQLPDLIWQAISGIKEVRELTSDQQQELRKQLVKESARTSQRIRELFLQKIDFGQVVEDVSYVVYNKFFSEAEITDLISFYRSSTGKKTIEVMPSLFAESMSYILEVIKPKVAEITTELTNEEVNRVRRDLELRKPKPISKPSPPRQKRRS